MLVSICCITYNHALFIDQALQGFLLQKTSFETEIIIHDDASTDDTVTIIRNFAAKHNLPVILKANKNNIGVSKNFYEALTHGKGKYIAICEGDDYWIDPFKLQKQVDFLEAHPDYAICCHNAQILRVDDPDLLAFTNEENDFSSAGFERLSKGEFMSTPTVVYRKACFDNFPARAIPYLNNYTLNLHNALSGNIAYLPEVMSVYRVHKGGVWSMVPRINTLINHLPAYRFYIEYFGAKNHKVFKSHVAGMTKELMELAYQQHAWTVFFRYLPIYVRYNGWQWSFFRPKISGALRQTLKK